MWHLEKPSSKDLDNYVGKVFPLVKKKILGRRKKGHFLVWCDYLLPSGDDDNMIRNVLVAEPEELVKLNKKYLEEMKNKTYEESMARLEEITKKIEARELTIDELSNNLKEAQHLLKFCKDKLYKTDEDIQKILDKSEDI